LNYSDLFSLTQQSANKNRLKMVNFSSSASVLSVASALFSQSITTTNAFTFIPTRSTNTINDKSKFIFTSCINNHISSTTCTSTTTRHYATTFSTKTNTYLHQSAVTTQEDETIPISSKQQEEEELTSTETEQSIVRQIATGTVLSFVPSSNGVSGIMALKIREESSSTSPPTVAPVTTTTNINTATVDSNEDGTIQENGAVDGDEDSTPTVKSSIESSIFGGGEAAAAATATSNQNAQRGEDYMGKTIVFPNGKTGVIVAQRAPLAFALCDFASYDDSDENNIISVLSQRTSISVGDHLLGQIVDCYGNPISFPNKEGNNQQVSSEESSLSSSTTPTVDRAMFAPIPQVKDIALINTPMLTGSAMVDALAPIGRGQNMLIVGQENKDIGQRDLVITALQTQILEHDMNKKNGKDSTSSRNIKCVYALTTNDKEERDAVLAKLADAGVLDDIVVVTTRDSMNDGDDELAADSAESIAVAATACSIGEAYALANGDDTLVIIDDINQHKSLWDWTTRILVDVYGLDAVVQDDKEGGASSEMRAFYSSLIQRAGRFNKGNGGGSATLALIYNLLGEVSLDQGEESIVFSADDFADSAEKVKQRIAILVDKKIPLTPENLRKIQIPLPTSSESEKLRRLSIQHTDDLISMSDGQIWLDESLHANGQRPPIDTQRSITRVGIGADTNSRADAPAMRGLAGGLRFEFAQALSLEGADVNSGADKQLLKKNEYLLAMHQEMEEGRTLSENCVCLLAASLGSFSDTVRQGGTAGTELGQSVVKGLIGHAWQYVPDAMLEIDNSLDLTPSVRSKLEDMIKNHLE